MHVTFGSPQERGLASFIAWICIKGFAFCCYCCTRHNPQLENLQNAIPRFPLHMCAFAVVSCRKFTIHFLAPPLHIWPHCESKMTRGSDQLSQDGQIRSIPVAEIKRTTVNLHNSPTKSDYSIASLFRDQGHLIFVPTLTILLAGKSSQVNRFTARNARPGTTCPKRWEPIATEASTNRSLLQIPSPSSTANITCKFALDIRGYQYTSNFH